MKPQPKLDWLQWVFIVMLFAVCLLISGCAAAPQGSIPVNVAVAIKCLAKAPTRPAMPTETLSAEPPATFLDRLVAALTAEIEVREGYEVLLAAELQSCL